MLGTRKAESQKRAADAWKSTRPTRVRERLSPNASLPNSLVYTPIEDWTNDDVWLYLMQVKNPWGHDNKSLLGMYQGASEGGECPLVVDTTTPSCGSSRFGCWVCTVVDKDRSMEAMIKNDEEKVWMTPAPRAAQRAGQARRPRPAGLPSDERPGAAFPRPDDPRPLHRKNGASTGCGGCSRPSRASARTARPTSRDLKLITLEELHEIRRIWLHEKHEFDDSLPRIYEEVTGTPFPKKADDGNWLRRDDWELLREVCGEDQAFFDLQVSLLGVERRFRGMTRRSGVFEALEDRFRAGMFVSEQEAIAVLTRQRDRREEVGGNNAEGPAETRGNLFDAPAASFGGEAE